MRSLLKILVVVGLLLPGAYARAQAGGEDPGDGGGPQRCWNCNDEIRDGVTYHLCQFGSLTGYAGCIGGGSGTVSNCTHSSVECPTTDAELLATNSVARDGFSTAGRRLTLASIEHSTAGPIALRAVAGLSDCKGYVITLASTRVSRVVTEGPSISVSLRSP